MKTLFHSILVLSLLAAGSSQAGTVTVTSVSTMPTTDSWYLTNFRGTSNEYTSNTFAGITNANPRNGNGSVEMSSTDGSGKADYAYTWGFVDGRTLGNVDVVGFDWFRAPGTSASHLAPAMRLLYDADGDAGTAGDRGYLIWEQVYNGPTAQNTWVSSDLEQQYFWQRKFSPGTTVEDFDMTLDDWAAGSTPNVPNGTPYDLLGTSTAILGIEFGIGSGWGNTFRGFVDNVRIGFTGEDATTFNFETADAEVPEPASLALLGLGVLGLAAGRRRKLS